MSSRPILSEQVILITGASTGIGAALAQLLATHFPGIGLVLAARRPERLEAAAVQCREAGARVLVVPTDMGRTEQVQVLADKAVDYFGKVDGLVNNAGYGQMGPVELLPPAAITRQFEVNVFGTITLMQALIPVMRSQGGGRIINLSSLAGQIAFPMNGIYCASKFALEGLSDALRRELAPFNIQVVVVEPGPVKTEFFATAAQEAARAIPNPERSPYRAAFVKLSQIERNLALQFWNPERVARVILRALSAPRPQTRYVAAAGGNIALSLLTSWLPLRMTDTLWQRLYGIDQVARDWQGRQE